ncbi:2-amino-4-hydroxy-6-hydroxymethyldihydropteridine diphosphokinase [Desulfuromonas sp. TF]|uniref:2-amino-4-hydroxy-6- hydroxymethyldihydropteridine diphosphokinase n=1 Tax=Desulfuromonas sp. TF TaxID=1232410 RepID=UPI00040A35C8|nr:2-amino-4-hydroxy-6-hydroxymethyldihydropteridine diphosphokinase [Desulfuromonas sp. TF]
MITAYLALGSNLGDREEILKGARRTLSAAPGVRVTAWSPLYLTEPVGGPEGQGLYLNAVLEVETELSAQDLLQRCLEVERCFDRQREERWSARTLDVDLLFWGEETRCEPDLVIPHPRMHLRQFVLTPLRDLAPNLLHPLLGRTVCELLADLPPGDGVTRFLENW